MTLTVLMTMLASLTLLPSLLTIFGRRIEQRIRKHAAKQARAGPALAALGRPGPARGRGPRSSCAVAALGALAAPALRMQLGFADAGNDHPSTTSRQAYDLIAEGFGPGANGPLVVVTEGTEAAAAGGVRHPDADRRASPRRPRRRPRPTARCSRAWRSPTTSPQDAGDQRPGAPTARRPAATARLVGGPTAAAVDFSEAVGDRFPLFIGVVVGLSALLLLLVFRSVAIAIKAAVLNLLSIGASLGVITLVFQDGWFGAQPGPDRGVRAGDDLRDRVRAVDGLRGLPGLPDARGVAAHRRSRWSPSARGWPPPAA